jgi:diguanylate cyclase (GGDEF)-like protein/PAS domain S-box-containing protein
MLDLFKLTRMGALVTNAKGIILDVNESLTRITGFQREEVVGFSPRIFKSGMQKPDFYRSMWSSLNDCGFWEGEIWNRRRDNEIYCEWLAINRVIDVSNEECRYVAIFTDISCVKNNELKWRDAAQYDSLTKLPNRTLLATRLDQAIAQSKICKKNFAVLYIDLDGFKLVNDKYGHDAGDALLISLANRLRECFREEDTVARVGGDEFMAILFDLQRAQTCMPMLRRILNVASETYSFGEYGLTVSASIGVRFCTHKEFLDREVIIKEADLAMYKAKYAGKSNYRFYKTG